LKEEEIKIHSCKEALMKKHSIALSDEQRRRLEQLVSKGVAPARQIKHAHILLKADSSEGGPNWSDEQIHEAFGVGVSTIWRVRRRFLENGLEDALTRRPQPPRPEKRILNGRQEAYLIALSCGEKPQGRTRWSVRLLAHKMVEVGYVEQVGRETIRTTLKKMDLNRG
jgi:transposase